METPQERLDKLTNPLVIKRLLRKGGVLRTSKGVYEIMANVVHHFVKRFLHACILIATQGNKKTVTHASLQTACSVLGVKLAVGINHSAKVTPSLTTGPSFRKKAKVGDQKEPKKRRKTRQGKTSAKEVAFQQRTDRLVFRKATFSNYCKALAKDSSEMVTVSRKVDLDTLRWSKSVFPLIQVICERFLVSLAVSSWRLVTDTERKTIKSAHIISVLTVMEECGSYSSFL